MLQTRSCCEAMVSHLFFPVSTFFLEVGVGGLVVSRCLEMDVDVDGDGLLLDAMVLIGVGSDGGRRTSLFVRRW